MPESRLARARKSIPDDYRFGDAGKPRIAIRFLKSYDVHVWDERERRWREACHAPEGAQLGRPMSCH